jgi:hypothetical protein
MNVELLVKLHNRSVALDGSKRCLRLEGVCGFRRGRLDMVSGYSVPAVRQKFHLAPCPDFRHRF